MTFLKYLQLNGFFGRKFSHVFDLKNMICTQTKDLGGKNGLNSSDFDSFN
jgi:hypothetical protein